MIRLDKSEKIPTEFEQYAQDGAVTEKTGVLRVRLEMDEAKNKTILTEQYSKAPLLVQKALHYDVANPSMAYLFLMSSSGGILQGDRYRIDISIKNKAIANITIQGAGSVQTERPDMKTSLCSDRDLVFCGNCKVSGSLITLSTVGSSKGDRHD